MSWRALCCAWRWKASAIPPDCTTERWSDCYQRPPGARRAVLMCGLPNSSASQWIWSQFTLADHVFVWLTNALYLIFKFAAAHRQSFDDDIRAIRHIQARRKQTLTNLEFVHDTLPQPLPNFTLPIGASLRKRN